MINLETSYLGLKLKNPIIVSSSGLTNSVEKLKNLEYNGAGAVVLKSLFEEQIEFEAGHLISNSEEHPETEDYIRNYVKSNSVEAYLELIEEAKATLSIPVFASINCVSPLDWTSFAKKIEEAGADALELNIYILPTDKNVEASVIEQTYFDIVEKVSQSISIPLVIKLGYNFTNLINIVNRLSVLGVSAVVLFNRFYEPDIDIDNFHLVSSDVFSSSGDIRLSLRWVAIIADKIKKMEIAASTGVHDGKAAIKQLLAGAQTVQICSTLYKNGNKQIKHILDEMEAWMEKFEYSSIDDFRGKMSYKNIKNPAAYQRAQFMKYFSNID
ncbi:MAG: dihydroorotate dehydrogenase-like protein [Chlorobi bacterium]|nr:dihydroorotate dehydrogenase-like protein [Chlorobiota bacterium]